MDTAADLDLRGIGQALWRRRGWVIVPTCVAAVLSLLAVNLLTPRYRSEARILIEGRESVFVRPEADKAGERDRAGVDAEGVQSQVQLILSKDLAAQVIRQLKLGERPEFDPALRGFSSLRYVLVALGLARDPLSMTAEERALETYFSRLTAYPVDKSRVIAVEFESADPALAARVANAIGETYLVMQQSAKQEQTRAAGRWLAGEIESLRGKVVEAEARVEDYRSKSNLFVGPNNTTLSNQQLGELITQLSSARAQKADMEARARLIRDLLRRGAPIEASDVLNSELLRRLGEQRATLRAQLAEQSSTLLDQHPRIKELRAQIVEIDRSIKSEAEKTARAFETDARIAGAKVEALSTNLDQLKRLAATSNEQDIRLRSLEREAKAQRELLESYLAKYREASARDSLSGTPGDARIISAAVVSNTPAFPKKLPIVLVATLATLFLSGGIVLSGELMRATVRATDPQRWGAEEIGLVPQQIEPRVSVVPQAEPATVVQAQAPADHDDIGSNRSNVMNSAPTQPSPASGGGLGRGHHLERDDREKPVPTFLHPAQELERIAQELKPASGAGILAVVGVAADGATTTLAVALARRLARERRVVLVDCAFSAPHPSAIGGAPGAPGLAELVHGGRSFSDIITRDRQSRAHLVGPGAVGRDGDDLWTSERLGMAFDALARSYDVVIIDAGVPSAKAAPRLARLAGRALLVTHGVAPEPVVIARERLLAAGFADIVDCGALPHVDAPAAADMGAPEAA